MVAYLFNSTACLLAFYLFYRLLLEQQSYHGFKRAYLLLSLVGGLLIPLIRIPETVVVAAGQRGATRALWLLQTETGRGPDAASLFTAVVYGAGLLLFGYFFLRNLTRLLAKIRRHTREQPWPSLCQRGRNSPAYRSMAARASSAS